MNLEKTLLLVSLVLLFMSMRNYLLARHLRMRCEEAMKNIEAIDRMLDEAEKLAREHKGDEKDGTR